MTEATDKLAALRTRFLDRCREDRGLLQTARADAADVNDETLRFCVHRLAGAAGTFGFKDLSVAAGEADDELVQGRRPSTEQLDRVLETLDAALAQSV